MGLSPLMHAQKFATVKPAPTHLTEEQQQTLIDAARIYDQRPRVGGYLADALIVLSGTGVRTGELLALQTQHFNPEKEQLRVTGTVKESPIRRQEGTKSVAGNRVLRVPEFVMDVLVRRTEGRPADAFIFEARPVAGRPPSPVSPSNFRRGFRGFLADDDLLSTIPDLTPKALRRVVAQLIAEDGNVDGSLAQLGHGDRASLKHYAEVLPVSDASGVLQQRDPDKTLKATAWMALQDAAAAHKLVLGPAELTRWTGTAYLRPSDINVDGPAGLTGFKRALEALRVIYPNLNPALNWSDEMEF